MRFTKSTTLQEGNFHWNLNFAISLMANLLNLNSAYYYILRNLLMLAYTMNFKNQNSLIHVFNSVNVTNLSQVAELNSLCIFILKATCITQPKARSVLGVYLLVSLALLVPSLLDILEDPFLPSFLGHLGIHQNHRRLGLH